MRCPACDAINLAGAVFCGQCHQRFDQTAPAQALAPRHPPVTRPLGDPHEWARAKTLEAVAPGLGHLRTQQHATGIARAGITTLWLVSAIVLWFGGAAGRLSSIPLIVGVAVVWASGPADISASRAGQSPWLDPHRFAWLVIGVTAAVIVVGGLVILS